MSTHISGADTTAPVQQAQCLHTLVVLTQQALYSKPNIYTHEWYWQQPLYSKWSGPASPMSTHLWYWHYTPTTGFKTRKACHLCDPRRSPVWKRILKHMYNKHSGSARCIIYLASVNSKQENKTGHTDEVLLLRERHDSQGTYSTHKEASLRSSTVSRSDNLMVQVCVAVRSHFTDNLFNSSTPKILRRETS